MKFIIEGLYKESKKEIITLTWFDYRTIKTFEEAKEKFWFKDWMKEGLNHREDKERQMIVRDIIEELTVRTIEIKNLQDLLNLQSKYGEIVIENTRYEEIKYSLNIL